MKGGLQILCAVHRGGKAFVCGEQLCRALEGAVPVAPGEELVTRSELLGRAKRKQLMHACMHLCVFACMCICK